MASPPYIMTPVPKADIMRGDGAIVTQFVEGFCRITKESLGGSAGTLLNMRNWQNNIIGCTYARRPDGRYRHRQALIGLPRKNGKSALGSSFALQGLVMGDYGSEIYSCAVDKNQARVVFDVAKQMVRMDPQLDAEQGGIIKIWRDRLEYTEKNSFYQVLSSDAITKEGLNPNVVIYDELHGAPTSELYDVMQLAQGSRKSPLLIAITTAGKKTDQTGQDSTCYRLYQHGARIAAGEAEDETFFMVWFGVPDNSDYRDPAVWAAANPGFDDLVDSEDFAAVINRTSEAEFRTKRLNQWVSSMNTWLPQGAWNACQTEREFTPGNRGIVLGFDGSRSRDTTALVAVTVSTEPQVKVLAHWKKPQDDPHWRVPRAEVLDRIRRACLEEYKGLVREVAYDPYLWTDVFEELEAEGCPVVEFPQTPTRMMPATQRMYEAVQNRRISHDGNPELARHFEHCQVRLDVRGARVVKESKDSPRKIDLAIATIIAYDRAAYFLTIPMEPHIDGKPVSDIQFVWSNSDARVSPGEKCCKCGNPVIKYPDGSPRLRRIGLQIVCTPPCDGTAVIEEPEEDLTEQPRYVW